VGEYYYLITAEGGTGYDHCVSVARSKDLYGPYEVHPDNPILTSYPDSPLQKCGHGDIVFDKDGRSYIVFLCSRPVDGNVSVLGRETAIEELVWEDGWPRLKNGTKCAGLTVDHESLQKESAVFYDDFSEKDIRKVYSSPRRSYREFAEICQGKREERVLRITGRESINSFFRVSLLAYRIQEINVRAVTRMRFSSFSSEQMAGLCIVYDALNNYMFVQTSDDGRPCLKLIKSDKGVVEELETVFVNDIDDGIELSIEMCGGEKIFFGYRMQGEWFMMDSVVCADILSDEYCRGFTGTQIGMYAHDLRGSGAYAEFLYFKVEEEK
jgi:xylan 1,4-beta-xylosidase